MEALIGVVVNAIVGPIADKALEAYKDKNATEISKEKLVADFKKVALNAALDSYKSGNDLAWRLFDSFQQSLRASAEIRRVWCATVYSQLLFVIYLEIGVPLLVRLGVIHSWPVGSLDTWAISFLGAALGVAPIVLKAPKPPVV